MKIFYNSKIAKLFTFLPGFKVIMLFGMIFTETSSLIERVIKHETTHCIQYKGCFIIGLVLGLIYTFTHGIGILSFLFPILFYYILYVWSYLIRLIINFILLKIMGKKFTFMELSDIAYESICFEREARDSETSENKVGLFTFLRYVSIGIII